MRQQVFRLSELPLYSSLNSTVSYGGPKGRAMRQYLSDNVYATIDNIYAMVDDNYTMIDDNYATMMM